MGLIRLVVNSGFLILAAFIAVLLYLIYSEDLKKDHGLTQEAQAKPAEQVVDSAIRVEPQGTKTTEVVEKVAVAPVAPAEPLPVATPTAEVVTAAPQAPIQEVIPTEAEAVVETSNTLADSTPVTPAPEVAVLVAQTSASAETPASSEQPAAVAEEVVSATASIEIAPEEAVASEATSSSEPSTADAQTQPASTESAVAEAVVTPEVAAQREEQAPSVQLIVEAVPEPTPEPTPQTAVTDTEATAKEPSNFTTSEAETPHAPPAIPNTDEDWTRTWVRARGLVFAGELKQAQQLYWDALAASGFNVQIAGELGDVSLMLQETDVAINAYFNSGRLALERQDEESFVKALKILDELEPKAANYLRWMAKQNRRAQ